MTVDIFYKRIIKKYKQNAEVPELSSQCNNWGILGNNLGKGGKGAMGLSLEELLEE
jgi:hypothetical protein